MLKRKRNPDRGKGPEQPLHYKKQEGFCRAIAIRKLSPTDAYMEAYGQANRRSASKLANELLKRDVVNARIAYLADVDVREEIHAIGLDRTWVEREMLAQYVEANRDGDRSNAIKVLQLLGVDLGMFVQRREVLSGKMDVMKEATDVVKRQIASRLRLLFPGADLTGFSDGGAGEGTPGATLEHPGDASAQPPSDLRALPEATGISQVGEAEEETLPDGRESGGQDVLRGNGSGLPPHR